MCVNLQSVKYKKLCNVGITVYQLRDNTVIIITRKENVFKI